jgi:hypothetical protein
MNSKFCQCGAEIPEGRLKALPNTTTCTPCSSTGKKGAITVQIGEGDHTYNDIIILEPEQLEQYNQLFSSSSFDEFEETGETPIEEPYVELSKHISNEDPTETSEPEYDDDPIEDDEQDWELSDDTDA